VSTYGVQIRPDQYTVVPYGIVPAPDGEVQPLEGSWEGHIPTVLYVGRLEKRKGIRDLFEAIPRVIAQFGEVAFVIAGADNSLHDGFAAERGMDYPTYFRHRYPGHTQYVRFTGAVSDSELQILYQACDLFVAPSLYESFGLVYLEAMNYARPVIGCRAGGVPEVIEDGVTGLLVEPAAPMVLAEAITALLRQPARLREMGLVGRERVRDRHTYLRMAADYAEVYRRVVDEFAAAQRISGGEDEP